MSSIFFPGGVEGLKACKPAQQPLSILAHDQQIVICSFDRVILLSETSRRVLLKMVLFGVETVCSRVLCCFSMDLATTHGR